MGKVLENMFLERVLGTSSGTCAKRAFPGIYSAVPSKREKVSWICQSGRKSDSCIVAVRNIDLDMFMTVSSSNWQRNTRVAVIGSVKAGKIKFVFKHVLNLFHCFLLPRPQYNTVLCFNSMHAVLQSFYFNKKQAFTKKYLCDYFIIIYKIAYAATT